MTRSSVPTQPVASTTRVSVSAIQQRLVGLDRSDNEYLQLLLELLSHGDLKPHILGLQGDDLRGFIELLDNALNQIPVTDDLFRKTLRRLQSTCRNREVLPSSYLIPSERISNRGDRFASGGFADVHQAELDGNLVCIKALRSYTLDTLGVINKIFYSEVIVWKRLRHPNIVPFLGVPAKIPPFEIICDWMENGRILEYLENHPEEDRMGLLWDVAEGLHYLHSCNIIHGDLKAANILIDKSGRARLTDFGLTSITRGDNSTRSPQDPAIPSTATWAAPEILQGGTETKEGDVFTFAMVTIETFTGHTPFATNYQSALYEIMDGKRPGRPKKLKHDGLWKLIQRCWNQDSRKRPNSSEIRDFFKALFPGKREIAKPLVLPSTTSTWTLTDSKAHPDGRTEPGPDKPRKEQDTDGQGPHDPSTENPRPPEQEPQSQGDRPPPVTILSEPKLPNTVDAPGSQKENVPPQIENNSPPPRQQISKFRKFMRKLTCHC